MTFILGNKNRKEPMQIGSLCIYLDTGSGLSIRKNKGKKILSVLGVVLIPVVCIVIMLLLTGRATPVFPDAEGLFWMIAAAILLLSGFLFNLRRVKRSNSNYSIKVNDGKILINSVLFCEKIKLDHVLIQPVSGHEGIGESFTVGLTSGRSFLAIAFDNNIFDANALATIIADYLGTKVVTGKSAFSHLKGY